MTPKAQKKALDKERDYLYQEGLTLNGFREHCRGLAYVAGFTDCEFAYSLSSCQGDGVSFSGSIDKERLIKEALGDTVKPSVVKVLAAYATVELTGNTGRYCYPAENQVDFYIPRAKVPRLDEVAATVCTHLEHKYVSLCKLLEKKGYEWQDNATADDVIVERFEDEKAEFTEHGERYND